MKEGLRWLGWLSLVGLLALLPVMCTMEARHRDVSRDSPYAARIGMACTVQEPMRAHGVMGFDARDRRTQWVSVWNPGFSGPELTFVEYLPEGTVLRVLGARKCSNCPFDARPEFLVSVEPLPPAMAGVPVYVQAEMFREGQVRCPAPASAR